MFINEGRFFNWSRSNQCWFIFTTVITNAKLTKEIVYIPFVRNNNSVIINQGLNEDSYMVTTGYSILTNK